MAHRLTSHRLRSWTSLALAVVAATSTAAACGGGGGGDEGEGGGAGQPKPAGRAALAGTAYTSDQLEQALLTEAPGYRRNGEPDSGEYGALKAIQNFNQLQRQVTIDKPACGNYGSTRPGGPPVDKTAPAAIISFTKGSGQSVTETLMSMSADAADKHVNSRIPDGCETFRTKVGGQWADHRVVQPPPGQIGDGSRTVGITTSSGGSTLKSWYVVLRGRRYVATISLVGPRATRAEAEQLARQADAQARRILP
ncbi:hypothetical protein Acsp03_48070 [Actinomadura sp. NBRC 104412]|uniref:hypothetical protein n=1 Tax=Actinomadura sp. NBRC 104412 TaxID=3032203 RepID=UPI0024A31F48|nr:hypothetical protein [Actinomadura sp. NBRC 104412]GLZ07341.1 hypothetical protein Acsp03_48070 [Actinomadura sp. NBRC 104412]